MISTNILNHEPVTKNIYNRIFLNLQTILTMKTLKFYALTGAIALAMVFASCSKEEVDAPFSSASNSASKTLTSFEKADLLSLLETQKLHRDVYLWMHAQVEKSVLAELADRDARYMDLLSVRVDKYGIENPTADRVAGEYADAAIQNEYNEFIRTNLEWAEMVNYAIQMEESLISAICQCESKLQGNTDLGRIYQDMKKESEIAVYELNLEEKGLIHIFAPKPEIKDM